MGAAKGVKIVVDRFFGTESDIEVFCALGDAGGGAAIQNLHKKLMEIKAMPDNSKEANCALHALQKALETACIQTMGDQGLGVRTPWQLLYVFSSLMKKLKEVGGIQFVDNLWAMVQHELQNNPEWEGIGQSRMKQAWVGMIVMVNEVELDEDGVNGITKWLTESPRNIQDPVWTRWGTVSILPSFKCFESCSILTHLFYSWHHRLLQLRILYWITGHKSTSWPWESKQNGHQTLICGSVRVLSFRL